MLAAAPAPEISVQASAPIQGRRPQGSRETIRIARYAAKPKYARGMPKSREAGCRATASQPPLEPHGRVSPSPCPKDSTPETNNPPNASRRYMKPAAELSRSSPGDSKVCEVMLFSIFDLRFAIAPP